MSEEEVTAHLGKPQKQEIRGETKFLFYATSWQVAEKAKQRSPIAIRQGNVVGLGVAYLAKFSPPDVKWDAWVVEVRPEEPKRLTSGSISFSNEVVAAQQLRLSRSPDAPHVWENFRLGS